MKGQNSMIAAIGLPAHGLLGTEDDDPEDKQAQAEKLLARAEVAARCDYERVSDSHADEIYYIDPSERY